MLLSLSAVFALLLPVLCVVLHFQRSVKGPLGPGTNLELRDICMLMSSVQFSTETWDQSACHLLNASLLHVRSFDCWNQASPLFQCVCEKELGD